jgi:serine/threonine protein kinase
VIKPQRFGRYLLLDRLSTGGMAEVFLAKSSGLHGFEKVVAIKRILPSVSEDSDFTTMFVDEARISANLNHVNIAQIFEFGQVDGQYYIAMEYIPGKDLRAIQSHLADTGRVMEVPTALHIAGRLCQAIDYAHRQKNAQGESMEIIHRDVSPPNVIAAYEGAVKLIDFGIAKAASRATRTRAGKLKGKFAYMSPEQVQGLTLDHRSDIFSLGTLIHELLTGRRLFQGENQIGTLNLVRRAEVPAPSTINPEVPLEVDRIVLKALCRNRDERYSWASELRADIERYLSRSGVVFESNHLAEWMRAEFAGEIEAERRMRERIHNLKLEDIDADEPAPERASQPEVDADTSARTEGASAAAGTPPTESAGMTASGAEAEQQDPAREDLPQEKEPGPGEEPAPEAELDEGLEELEGEPTMAATSLVSELREEAGRRPSRELHPEEIPEAEDAAPPVYGPSAAKEHDSIAHLATMLQTAGDGSLDPHTAEELGFADANLGPEDPDQIKVPLQRGRGGAIVPGPDRAATTVGGALEVESKPDRALPPTRGERAVDVERGMGAVFEGIGQGSTAPAEVHGAGHSGTRQIQAGRFSSMQVMAIAGGATLLLAGVVILAALLLSRESGGGSAETGSIVVTSQPPASCSVSLGATPKGILEPGSSLTLPSVPAGSHLVSVECAGFHAYATTVDVKGSQAALVVAPLERK